MRVGGQGETRIHKHTQGYMISICLQLQNILTVSNKDIIEVYYNYHVFHYSITCIYCVFSD